MWNILAFINKYSIEYAEPAVHQFYSLHNTRGNTKCIILKTFLYTCRHFPHTIQGNPYLICMPLRIRDLTGGWEEHWEQGWANKDDAVQVCRERRRGEKHRRETAHWKQGRDTMKNTDEIQKRQDRDTCIMWVLRL